MLLQWLRRRRRRRLRGGQEQRQGLRRRRRRQVVFDGSVELALGQRLVVRNRPFVLTALFLANVSWVFSPPAWNKKKWCQQWNSF